ncbi:MAG: DUF4185 domain-containing protein [Candidatus Hydrogenedentes bacterium]|nr:DUF4185 domain-containing protein [Candidatus Hydrogenedentota bacterium]
MLSVLIFLLGAPGEPPYARSEAIIGIEFDFASHRRLASGSDNWPMTWADDGHQYTAWGDGGGFGGSNSEGRVSNGFARISGDGDEYTGVNVAGGLGAPRPAPFAGKCYGIIAVDTLLYAWRTGDASGETAYRFQELWKSTDRAATWTRTGVRFEPADFAPPGDRGFFAPAFLQCGQNNRLARDAYVYTYAPDIMHDVWNVHIPGRLTLFRAPAIALEDKTAYEFFAGVDAQGKPQWTRDPKDRKPVWEDRANGVMTTSAVYVPGLQRYLLWTEHTERWRSNLAVYEAETPWGPWRTVHFEYGWGRGALEESAFFWNLAPKWLEPDGAGFTLVFTGTASNDAWNTVQGRFLLRD